MEGCGADFCDDPWAFLLFYIMMGLALLGAGKVVIAVGGQVDVGGA